MKRMTVKHGILICALMFSAEFSVKLFAQESIPAGTILPVQMNSALKSNKARPGQVISARIMQDVPLSSGSSIHAGAKVLGRVVEAKAAGYAGTAAEVSIRFDMVAIGRRRIPVTTNLRALATMMDVSEAQVPETGPDRGTSEQEWATDQVGGEVNYHGGVVSNGAFNVGQSVPHGVLDRVSTQPGSTCRGVVDGNDRPQAMWVFSSDACGLYDFPHLRLAHAGRTAPMGEITLISNKGDVNIRSGSGMLLRVNANDFAQKNKSTKVN